MKKIDLKKTIENFWNEKESINSGNKNLTKTIVSKLSLRINNFK